MSALKGHPAGGALFIFEDGGKAMRNLIELFILLFAGASLSFSEILIGVRTATDHSPFYVADKYRLYEKERLKVEIRVVPSNTEIVEALKRRDFQMGVFPLPVAIAAISQGVPIKIVAMTGRGGDGILVLKDSEIRSVRDLKGKKIATIRASILDIMLRYALEQEGLVPERDVKFLYFMKLGDMIGPLKTRQVDACSHTEPFLTEAELSGWGRILVYYNRYWKDHPCCVVVAHQDFITSQPQNLKKILKVHLESVNYVNKNPEDTAKIICEYMKGFDPTVVLESLSIQRMKVDYKINAEEVLKMAQLMKRYGMIEEVPSVERSLELRFLKELTQR
jgi:NitT/TauT family transport system substrate-binding protein